MSCSAAKDFGEIYTRIFDSKPFVHAEIASFVKEFELKRKDREVENLFTSLQNSSEIRDPGLTRCATLAADNLPELRVRVAETELACQAALKSAAAIDAVAPSKFDPVRAANRARRERQWQQFCADVAHKQSRIDNTFEEKEEELREFYTDLASKLHMHI